jgi:hypothetical protein
MAHDDDAEDDLDEGDDAGRDYVLRHARSHGVKVAYEAALALARDPKSPAQARSNAIRLIFLAGGIRDRIEDEPAGKPLCEMSAAEIEAELARLRRQARKAERAAAGGRRAEGGGGVFG